jgi:hypothetical protein
MHSSNLSLPVTATKPMKNLILMALFGMMSLHAHAQYNYQTGLLPINGITYKVSVGSWGTIHFENNANMLYNTPWTPTNNPDCGLFDFKKIGELEIRNVFRESISDARRQLFLSKHRMEMSIYVNGSGKILEAYFWFAEGSPITPQELNQIELGLKNLPPQEILLFGDCAGMNYHVTSMTIFINKIL